MMGVSVSKFDPVQSLASSGSVEVQSVHQTDAAQHVGLSGQMDSLVAFLKI